MSSGGRAQAALVRIGAAARYRLPSGCVGQIRGVGT